MRLSQILPADCDALDASADVVIEGLALDSRFIHPGEVFVALSGGQVRGQDFIEMALERGACAVLTDQPIETELSVPVVYLPNLRMRLSAMAAEFYGHPSQSMSVVGVTGTNGKSSVCDLLQQAYRLLGVSGAAIGTLGVYGETLWRKPGMTTADPIQVQAELAMLRDAGVTHVAMEVSSHGLDQGRVEAVQFQSAVFTNLTRDHLDYHKTFEAYAQAKKRLFTELSCQTRHLNAQTPEAMSLATPADSIFCSAQGVGVENARPMASGWEFEWALGEQRIVTSTSLLGQFNLDNLSAMASVMLSQGFELADIARITPELTTVPGRMEWVSQQPAVLVDYAHTADGLQACLSAARAHCSGQLWVVFGAGGDRDVGKRPEMGRAASEYADRLIVTSDNPRSESPEAIIQDVLAGVTANYEVQPDRVDAIHHAIRTMSEQDVLVIAGKGHETEQVLADRVLQHDDREVARAALAEVLC